MSGCTLLPYSLSPSVAISLYAGSAPAVLQRTACSGPGSCLTRRGSHCRSRCNAMGAAPNARHVPALAPWVLASRVTYSTSSSADCAYGSRAFADSRVAVTERATGIYGKQGSTAGLRTTQKLKQAESDGRPDKTRVLHGPAGPQRTHGFFQSKRSSTVIP